VQASIIKRRKEKTQKIKKKPKSLTSQRNSKIIIILIGDKGENQLIFRLFKLQVKHREREFRFKLESGDYLLLKLKRKYSLKIQNLNEDSKDISLDAWMR